MALQDAVFAAKLEAIFSAMEAAAHDSPKDNAWYAAELAKAIDEQIKTAEVTPGIAVTIPTTSLPETPSQGATTGVGILM